MCRRASPIPRAVFSNKACCCASVIKTEKIARLFPVIAVDIMAQCAPSPSIGSGGSAVMMLVLSVTGATVVLEKLFVVYMVWFPLSRR